MKYEFTQYETDVYGGETGNKVSTSFHADSIDQVIERMHYFLKGSGFMFDGQLDIVSEDSDLETFKINVDNDNDISINLAGDGFDQNHSAYYYEFDRNRPFPFTAGSNDWDSGAAGPVSTVNLDDTFNINLESLNSNAFYHQFDTMAGYPSER